MVRKLAFAGALLGLVALAWQHPSVYERGQMLGRWASGSAPAISWRQLGVMMAPYFWRSHLRSWIQPTVPPWTGTLAEHKPKSANDFAMRSLIAGPAGSLESLDCHYSILPAGKTPHPPHSHVEEEIIVPLAGQVRVIRVSTSGEERTSILGLGQFAYHASNVAHTIESLGSGDAEYVVFRWKGRWQLDDVTFPSQDFDYRNEFAASARQGFSTQLLFESPTSQLGKLHAHLSAMTPGGGYEAHSDLHDIGIVLLAGEVETMGKRITAHGVVFCPADSSHGMRNPGAEIARYLVFEFHPASAF